MGIRSITLVSVLLCAVAGWASSSVGEPRATTRTLGPTPTAQPVETPPDPEIGRLAGRFVQAGLGYDSSAESATAFLHRVALFVTPQELRHLSLSGRAELNWSAMRARRERATIDTTGTDVVAKGGQTSLLVVNAIRRTSSTLATTRDLIQVTLEITHRHDQWLVVGSSGAGL